MLFCLSARPAKPRSQLVICPQVGCTDCTFASIKRPFFLVLICAKLSIYLFPAVHRQRGRQQWAWPGRWTRKFLCFHRCQINMLFRLGSTSWVSEARYCWMLYNGYLSTCMQLKRKRRGRREIRSHRPAPATATRRFLKSPVDDWRGTCIWTGLHRVSKFLCLANVAPPGRQHAAAAWLRLFSHRRWTFSHHQGLVARASAQRRAGWLRWSSWRRPWVTQTPSGRKTLSGTGNHSASW